MWKCIGVVDHEFATHKKFFEAESSSQGFLTSKSNTLYYVLTKERQFTDYPDLLNLQTKNGMSKLGVSYSTPDASAYFADYIRRTLES